MLRWKDGQTTEQVIEKILRNYLIRCHKKVSTEYPEIEGMDPVNAADYLLHLKRTGSVEIKLFNEGEYRIGCKITDKTAGDKGAERVGNGNTTHD